VFAITTKLTRYKKLICFEQRKDEFIPCSLRTDNVLLTYLGVVVVAVVFGRTVRFFADFDWRLKLIFPGTLLIFPADIPRCDIPCWYSPLWYSPLIFPDVVTVKQDVCSSAARNAVFDSVEAADRSMYENSLSTNTTTYTAQGRYKHQTESFNSFPACPRFVSC